MAYLKAGQRGETVFDSVAFANDIAPLIGGEVVEDMDRNWMGRLKFGELSMTLRPMHGANKGRVEVHLYHAENQRFGHSVKFPSITVDASRPLDKIAADIKRRVLDASAEPLAEIKAKIAAQDGARATVSECADQIRTRYPFAQISFRDPTFPEASLYMNAADSYLTGRLQKDGSLYVERVGSVGPARVTAVIGALFGPSLRVVWRLPETNEAGELVTYDARAAIDYASAKRMAGCEVDGPDPFKAA